MCSQAETVWVTLDDITIRVDVYVAIYQTIVGEKAHFGLGSIIDVVDEYQEHEGAEHSAWCDT